MGSDTDSNDDIVIFGHWVPQSGKLDQLLAALKPTRHGDNSMLVSLAAVSRKYLFTDDESFTSQKAYDAYLSSESKTTLDQVCVNEDLLREPQREHRLIPSTGFAFRSTGLYSAPGIHVAMAKINYAPGTRSQGIEQWQKVAASVEEYEKEGTHTYWFLADPKDGNVLYSLERYQDEKYLWDVHVPSLAIQQNMKNQKYIRTGLLLRIFESVE
ncbi:hypothetical protein EK21DRAFT_92915 [Setomelanomma holmii]|uniref:ABM domain-containing protein n=1 Tax=Setomelanomma holmii TaxID=210430 RepID=A0A9P4H1V1_9PLEO|nr:hypothetical protein EK21DRAFT_92915 [Setomelanomma holmii]